MRDQKSAIFRAVELWRKLCWGVIYWGPRRDVTLDTFNGRLTVDSKDWLIGKYLYVKRRHETGEMESAIELLEAEGYLPDLRSPKSVLNVGANIGMTAIGLVKNGYFKQAIAFEPTPNSYRLLVRNINENGLRDRIQHFPIALSSRDGEMELELSRDNSGDNRIRLTQKPGFYSEEKRPTIKVPVRTLDGLVAENAALRDEPVGLVWVDIQGHEGQFFRGALQYLRRGIPVVSEFWPYGIDRSGLSPSELREIFAELFSHYYVLGVKPEQKFPISGVDALFRTYGGPREACVILLLPVRPA